MQPLLLEFEDEYTLIGIHSTEEDYRLAYILNKELNFKLTRHKNNLDFQNSEAEFPLFEYKNEHDYLNYYLINNKDTHLTNNNNNIGLFGGNYTTISYLIPEKNKIDYFLKIEGDVCSDFIQNLLESLNSIQQIITSYSIEPNNLKTKDHLIF